VLTEAEEKYPLEKGLPPFPVTPKPVEEYHQKHGYYPAVVIVNPKHQVKGIEYFKPRLAQAIEPLEDKDFDDAEVQEAHEVLGYYITIDFDEGVDVNTIICKGRSTLQRYHG
jgi:hypothetical protein